MQAVPISTGGTVPHGTPMVAEIEAKQREEAKKARPARDASKAEKENVPRPSHRAPRSHAGQTQRQQVLQVDMLLYYASFLAFCLPPVSITRYFTKNMSQGRQLDDLQWCWI